MCLDSKYLIIQHVEFEGPAAILDWMGNKPFDVWKPFLNQPKPKNSDYKGIIVMGGPMGVHDDLSWLKHEKEFLRESFALKKKTLGICLGSQLLADILGSQVRAGNSMEIGWHSIQLNVAAFKTQFEITVPENITAFHWHGDIFDCPKGAINLAQSKATQCQAFLYENFVLGLLCHLEMNEDAVELMLQNCNDDLKKNGPYIQDSSSIREGLSNSHQTQPLLHKILNSFFD